MNALSQQNKAIQDKDNTVIQEKERCPKHAKLRQKLRKRRAPASGCP
jgi:hypothetical protein